MAGIDLEELDVKLCKIDLFYVQKQRFLIKK